MPLDSWCAADRCGVLRLRGRFAFAKRPLRSGWQVSEGVRQL